jgi:hypothetical protein
MIRLTNHIVNLVKEKAALGRTKSQAAIELDLPINTVNYCALRFHIQFFGKRSQAKNERRKNSSLPLFQNGQITFIDLVAAADKERRRQIELAKKEAKYAPLYRKGWD